MTQCQEPWQGQHFVSAVKSGGNVAKSYFLSSFIRKREIVDFHLQSAKTGGSLARNAFIGPSNSQAGRSFLRFAWQRQYFRSVSIK